MAGRRRRSRRNTGPDLRVEPGGVEWIAQAYESGEIDGPEAARHLRALGIELQAGQSIPSVLSKLVGRRLKRKGSSAGPRQASRLRAPRLTKELSAGLLILHPSVSGEKDQKALLEEIAASYDTKEELEGWAEHVKSLAEAASARSTREAAHGGRGVGGGEEEEDQPTRSGKRLEELKLQKTTAIRGGKSRARSTTSLIDMAQWAKGVFFVEEDPPRMSRDHTEFCGNPIDATAYYLAMPSKTRSLSVWLTASERREGETIEAYRRRKTRELGAKKSRAVRLSSLDQITRIRKEQAVSGGHLVKRQSGVSQRLFGKGVVAGMDLLIGISDGSGGFVEAPPGSEGKQLYVFEVIEAKKSWSKERLREMFQPFAKRTFSVNQTGPIAEVVAKNLGMPLDLAKLLVLSGTVSMIGVVDGKRTTIPILNPVLPAVPSSGDISVTIEVSFAGKEDSPYFSWVTSELPLWRPGQSRPDFMCLSEEDKIHLHNLRAARRAINRYTAQMLGVRKLTGLRTEGAELGESKFTMSSLAHGTADLVGWWSSIMAGERGAEEILSVLHEMQYGYPSAHAEPLEDTIGRLKTAATQIDLVRESAGRYRGAVFHEMEGVELVEDLYRRGLPYFGAWGPFFGFLKKLFVGDVRDPLAGFRMGQPAVRLHVEELDEELPPGINDDQRFWAYISEMEGRAVEMRGPLADQALAVIYVVKALEPVFRQRYMLSKDATSHAKRDPDPASQERFFKQQDRLKTVLWQQTQYALLLWLYYHLEGYSLVGPLYQGGQGPFVRMVSQLDEMIRSLDGGITEQEKMVLYKTYNPVLYEITRLYWPEKTGVVWRGFDSRPELMADVDAAGRYGAGLEIVESIVASSADKEQMAKKLQEEVGRLVDALALKEAKTEKGQQAAAARQREMIKQAVKGRGRWKLFVQLWPLGSTWRGALEELTTLATEPEEFLALLKNEFTQAVSKTAAYSKRGIPSLLSRRPRALDVVETEEGEPRYIDPRRPRNDAERQSLLRVSGALERVLNLPEESLRLDRKAFEDAVVSFQTANELPASGLLDETTLAFLEEADRSRPRETARYWGESDFEVSSKGEIRPDFATIAQTRKAASSYEADLTAVRKARKAIERLLAR